MQIHLSIPDSIRRNFVLSIIFFLLAIIASRQFGDIETLESDARHIQNVVNQRESFIQTTLRSQRFLDFTLNFSKSSKTQSSKIINDFNKQNIGLLIFDKDSCIFWTDNRIIPEVNLFKDLGTTSFQKLANGDYCLVDTVINRLNIVCFIAIKSKYAYQNEYLENSLDSDFKIEKNLLVLRNTIFPKWAIKSNRGGFLFAISYDSLGANPEIPILKIILWLSGFIFLYLLIRAISRWFIYSQKQLGLGFFIFISLSILIRSFTLYIKWPVELYALELFSPTIYASSIILPSLGDFLLNTFLLLWIVDFIREHQIKFFRSRTKTKITHLRSVFYLLFILLFSELLSYLFRGLIINSSISFDVTNILSISIYSVIGFVLLGFCLYAIYQLSFMVVSFIDYFQYTKVEKIWLFMIAFSIFVAIKISIQSVDILIFASALYLIILERVRKTHKKQFSFSNAVLLLFIFSFASAIKLNEFNNKKEKGNRELLAGKLESNKDPVAEYLFLDIFKRIRKDNFIISYFKSPIQDRVLLNERLNKLYFGGYFSKYEVINYEYNLFNIPIASRYPPNYIIVDSVLRSSRISAENAGLFTLNDANGLQTYFSGIPIYFQGQFCGTLILQFKLRTLQENNPYPELLLDGDFGLNRDFYNYSYSVYANDKLVNQHGQYAYSLNSDEFGKVISGFSSIDINGYNHLLYKPANRTLIVMSKVKDSNYTLLAIFSYLFAFLSLMLFLFLLWTKFSKLFNLKVFTNDQINKFNSIKSFGVLYKTRIQSAVLITVVGSLILIGFITFSYLSRQYLVQQNSRVSQLTKAVVSAIEKDISDKGLNFSTNQDDFALNLTSLSAVYNTDINLYNLQGHLEISTQPKVFEKKLISEKMNPVAFEEMKNKMRTEIIAKEKIGKLEYFSAYAPLLNQNRETIAYINLPFFANPKEYNSEILNFLNTLINVYAFVFVLIGFFAVFIANSITKPLTLIENSIKKTKIGNHNEPITWKGKDEIGNLIREYNKMIIALEMSTAKLARSERESAWREMAKQVAHEIKNPLTPIKLGIQLLDRAYQNRDPEFKIKFEKFKNVLIEQIDSLSNIAIEFSDFAQMPITKNEIVKVDDVILKSMELFKNSSEVSITFLADAEENYIIADKDQLLRTCNNLIKNAIQAIKEESDGEIIISTKNIFDIIQISFTDNGIGIPNELKDKIFEPNFTTKSSGMGMGLAIIKNIVENSNGKIWFETEIGYGTSFYLNFPVYDNHTKS